MLIIKVLATVFISMSFLTMIIKNVIVISDRGKSNWFWLIVFTIYGILWRVLAILGLWLVV